MFMLMHRKSVAAWAGRSILVFMLVAIGAEAAEREPSRRETSTPRDVPPILPVNEAFQAVASMDNAILVNVQREALRQARREGKAFRIQRFPLTPERFVDLELEPLRVVGPEAKFVIGRKGGPDRPLAFDASSMEFFHGTVADRPGSSVYLAFSDSSSTGYVDLGLGFPRYRISERGGQGEPLGASRISVFETRGAPSSPAGVPLCGVEGEGPQVKAGLPAEGPVLPEELTTVAAASTVGVKHLQLAVETDYELFHLFNDATATLNYVLQMYGEVSAIYVRDVRMRVEVVFARIWDNPDDLFNGPDPLQNFYPYWIINMGGVARDAAQLFSGRRDYPFGGQAFLTQLCNFAYGVVGYAVGFQPDPSMPDPYSFDVGVTAHELGHNCAAHHTHDLGLDECDDPTTVPRRGSIMSYCSQTWSGMNANEDLFFHTANRTEMLAHINARACITLDCNFNGVPDSTDILLGAPDTNGNGIPDACEDCNNNGTLDPADISGGMPDLNGNGIPDGCEPDCNGNTVPDDRDIALGTSPDANADRIPDDCEADCNNNATSDYTEIQADMTLDRNRNAILDSCEDCDGDTAIDAAELAGAHELWVASGLDNEEVRRFHATVGVLTAITLPLPSTLVRSGQDVVISPSGVVLVSSALNDKVLAFNAVGTYLSDFVTAGSGGLNYPTGMTFMPGGDLLVASRDTDSVIRYNGSTGAFMGAFVAFGSGGLFLPFGLTYGPNGNLFVANDDNSVLEYNGATGAFIRVFVSASNNGGLSQPRGLAFKPDGNLLVASYGSDQVLEFDGLTGWPHGKWAFVGTETAITQDSPWGIRIGPNGHVYVTRTGTAFSSSPMARPDVDESHLTDARMFEYDVCTGDFRKTHIGGRDHGLDFATGFAFLPGWDVDCNFNQLQDDCDIASLFSQDVNTNDIPDECEVDCNGNGTYDRLDIWPYGSSLDCNCNFIPDECDLISGSSQDCNGNSRPDECEFDFDCDNNGTQDICDVAGGAGTDCNTNGVLDSCEAGSTGVLLSEDFEGGVPAGWSVSGIFQVTGSCAVNPACDGLAWAYAGDTGFCGYGDGEAGGLVLPPVALPPNATAELRYCQALNSEADFDFADVTVNNVRISRESGGSGTWENRVIDLTPFAGQTITILFRLESDSSVSGTLGWQVDNLEVVSTNTTEDCNFDDIPDECQPNEDCNNNFIRDICDIGAGSPDVNGNLIPDECEVCSVVQAPVMNVEGVANRYLSFTPGNVNKQMALRVVFDDLPPPYHIWNGTTMWVAPPQVRCQNGGQSLPPAPGNPPDYGCSIYAGLSRTYRIAGLQCTPFYADWHGKCLAGTCQGGLREGKACNNDANCAGSINVYHEGIVPGGRYLVQMVDQLCAPPLESDFSTPLPITNPRWGDVVKDCTTHPCPPVNDVVEIMDVVANLSAFTSEGPTVSKFRADIHGSDSSRLPDYIIGTTDFTYVLDAFVGKPYPHTPSGPAPCGP